MLKNVVIGHFKSVYDDITLPLAPLTIFAGANSSGKSTVLQGLLLATQTIQNPVRSRSVVLNGHILKLGEFDDILSDDASPPTIRLGFSLAVPAQSGFFRGGPHAGYPWTVDSVECEFTFTGGGRSDEADLRRLQPLLEQSRMRVTTSGEDRQELELVVRRSALTQVERARSFRVSTDSLNPVEFASLEYEVEAPSFLPSLRGFYPLPPSSRPAGASLFHFLPSRLSVVFDVVDQQEERVLQLLTAGPSSSEYYYPPSRRSLEAAGDIPSDVLVRLRPLLMRIFTEYLQEPGQQLRLPAGFPRSRPSLEALEEQFTFDSLSSFLRSFPVRDRRQLVARIAEKETDIRTAVRGGRQASYDMAVVPLPPLLDNGVELATQFFTRSVKYLGPLRDEPKPVYPLAGGADPKEIGYKGEHTAAVLETYRNVNVTYYSTSSLSQRSTDASPQEATLYHAVLDWLQYMGIADQVQTQDLGKLGHELKVAAGEGESVHDLTHVGVGVSQVLPILVLALLADPGSTLIFEQPELHLHPRVQTRLADFFVSLSRLGKQCLVETHSEYLISRLRYMAATSPDDTVSGSSLLYFVERRGGRSHYRPITINEYGVIESWPVGFFDETERLAASILKAGSDKRRQRK